jgi:4-amino-4-deoxy-L-arabinose transferase-like glycosyltransferase
MSSRAWGVAGLTLAAAVLHASGQWLRPLWLDEACTWWTLQAHPLEILQGARTDGSPPLYFLLVWLVTRVLGESEWALRTPSLLAAVALVPGLYWTGKRFVGERAAWVAAALAVISPLVHYYAVEARSYTLLQWMVLPVLVAFAHALAAPERWGRWALLSVAFLGLLYTHTWGVFLLPAPTVAVLCLGRPKPRVVLAAFVASAVAFAGYLPWLGNALATANQGVGDWIVPWWESTDFVLLRSLELFGYGGDYPVYLAYLGEAPATLRWLSLPVTFTLLGLAGFEMRHAEVQPRRALWAFLFVPLLAAFAFSSWQPLYLVGRYDTIALPAFLLLVGVGLDALLRWRRAAGVAMCAGIVGLAFVSMATSFAETAVTEPRNTAAAAHITQRFRAGDAVVTTGLRRAVVEYSLQRELGAESPSIHSFPAEIAEHPGWYSKARVAGDPFESIDRHLLDALQHVGLALDPAESDETLGLFAVKASPGARVPRVVEDVATRSGDLRACQGVVCRGKRLARCVSACASSL